jgi:hypothetical protein
MAMDASDLDWSCFFVNPPSITPQEDTHYANDADVARGQRTLPSDLGLSHAFGLPYTLFSFPNASPPSSDLTPHSGIAVDAADFNDTTFACGQDPDFNWQSHIDTHQGTIADVAGQRTLPDDLGLNRALGLAHPWPPLPSPGESPRPPFTDVTHQSGNAVARVFHNDPLFACGADLDENLDSWTPGRKVPL